MHRGGSVLMGQGLHLDGDTTTTRGSHWSTLRIIPQSLYRNYAPNLPLNTLAIDLIIIAHSLFSYGVEVILALQIGTYLVL